MCEQKRGAGRSIPRAAGDSAPDTTPDATFSAVSQAELANARAARYDKGTAERRALKDLAMSQKGVGGSCL
jgi:hypothetical protein